MADSVFNSTGSSSNAMSKSTGCNTRAHICLSLCRDRSSF
jgi:hypothetical protein